MDPSTHPERAGPIGTSTSIAGPLILALVVLLLAGAVLVRLVDDEAHAAAMSDSTGIADKVETASDEAPSADSSSRLRREGRPTPDFTLLDLEGQPVSLSDWRGRPLLINFWATWCGPCEVEMPAIQAAYEVHQADSLGVLAVAVDDNADNVRRFFEEYGLTFQPLMDDGAVSRAYQVFGLPTSFFVGADGKITAFHAGVLTERKIEEYLGRVKQDQGRMTSDG